MNFDPTTIFTSFSSLSVLTFIKGGFLIILFLGIIFLLIVLRQVFSMDKTIQTSGSIVVKLLAIILLLLAIWLFVASIGIL